MVWCGVVWCGVVWFVAYLTILLVVSVVVSVVALVVVVMIDADSSSDATSTAYIIPRDDGTVLLGGTFEVHNANLVPHPKTAQTIWERCQAISPTLAKLGTAATATTTATTNHHPTHHGYGMMMPAAAVLRHGVGLRPCRVGGMRLQAETRRTFVPLRVSLLSPISLSHPPCHTHPPCYTPRTPLPWTPRSDPPSSGGGCA